MFKLSETNKIIKNLFAVNISLLFVFSAQNCTSLIQTNLDTNNGKLGPVSQSVSLGTSIISALFIPSIICKIFGFKWSLIFAEIGVMIHVAFQVYPRWETIIPSIFI